MEDKSINLGHAVISLRRIEFLIEELLIHTISERFKELPDNERVDKIQDTMLHVDKQMKEFVESLPPAK